MQDTVLVMLKIATKSLFSKSACKMYPVREPVFFERTRGRIESESSKCILCTLCEKRCPTGAIVVDQKQRTWQIDRFRCILCGNCVASCKPNALKMINRYTGPVVKKQTEQHTVTPAMTKHKKTDSPAGSAGD